MSDYPDKIREYSETYANSERAEGLFRKLAGLLDKRYARESEEFRRKISGEFIGGVHRLCNDFVVYTERDSALAGVVNLLDLNIKDIENPKKCLEEYMGGLGPGKKTASYIKMTLDKKIDDSCRYPRTPRTKKSVREGGYGSPWMNLGAHLSNT